MVPTVALGLMLWLHTAGEGGRLRPIVADRTDPFRYEASAFRDWLGGGRAPVDD